MRKNFDETVKILREIGLAYEDQSPKIPDAMPRYDDEDPGGFSIFRMGLEDSDLSNLEMQRTFFSKSELLGCNFANTNLNESNLCWNDFINVNFVGADLSESDLRASIYECVDFSNANLANTDMRRCDFNNCKFSFANMSGALLSKAAGSMLSLSDQQNKEINWQDSDGEEPPGG